MTRPHVPQEVLDAAHARKAARLARDWAEADRLKTDIETAGWRVLDRGVDFRLVPAHPPDIDDGWRVRHGSRETITSRLTEPASVPVSLVLLVQDDDPEAPDRIRALDEVVARARSAVPGAPMVIAVGDQPETVTQTLRHAAASDPLIEVVWMSGRPGPASLAGAALRRAAGEIVVVLGPDGELKAGTIPLLIEALSDPGAAVAGGEGLSGEDLMNLQPAGPGPVVALDGSCVAVRRGDAARVDLDEHYLTWRGAAIAWTLALRDAGAQGSARTAIAVELSASEGSGADQQTLRSRAARRDRYRLAAAYGGRPDLIEVPGRG